MVTVGGIGPRPVLIGDHVENGDDPTLTIGVDHDIVDGAHAGRFVDRLRHLIGTGHRLDAARGSP